ncbi:MAG: TonB-dependent receptor [Opitutaceae bacterium]|nr:TonB-dependent receptor [Opitutaceae bacterium]
MKSLSPKTWMVWAGIALAVLAAGSPEVRAATGTISGRIVSNASGAGVFGASVRVRGADAATSTDLNGAFRIEQVAAGAHDVLITRNEFQSATIAGVAVTAGEVSRIEFALVPATEPILRLEALTVSADVVANSGVGLLAQRQKAAGVSDAISSDQMSRLGFNDAAQAMKAVTGASVVDGKYVYIRGLGERYSSTSLNGAEVPSADPERRAVQMDLFPAELIDAIVTSKTFTPDRPGNFSGGNVDIRTKSLPDARTFAFSASTTFNTQSTGESLLRTGAGTDWLGRDDGSRQLPGELQAMTIPARGTATDAEIGRLSRLLSPVMAPTRGQAPWNRKLALSYGDRLDFGTQRVGVIASLTYDRSYSSYTGGRVGRHELQGVGSTALSTTVSLDDERGAQETSAGATAKLSWQLSPEHEVSINGLFNTTGEDVARVQRGLYIAGGGLDNDQTYTTRTLKFTERELRSGQLTGRHLFSGWRGLLAEWSASSARNTQDEPDTRFFNHSSREIAGQTYYEWETSGLANPARYYRRLEETRRDYALDLTLPLVIGGRDAKLKAGSALARIERGFRERQYLYRSLGRRFDGNDQTFFLPANVGAVNPATGRFANDTLFLQDTSAPRNNYDGAMDVDGHYFMADVPVTARLRAIGGVRIETTDLRVMSQDPTRRPGLLDLRDTLPSLNLVYELHPRMNLRAAFGRTLARPNFREMAPYETFEFVGDFVYIGNPDLKRTVIDNYDLRWEWFTGPGRIVAVSAFWKDLKNPIEKAIFAPTGVIINQGEIQFQNPEKGRVYGAEFEFRQRLGGLSERLKYFTFGLNLTFVESTVTVPAGELRMAQLFNPAASGTRPLAGQSNHLVNGDLSYSNPRTRTAASIYYNLFGERLALVSPPGTPDIFEQPAAELDFILSQKFGDRWKVGFSAKNLLNPAEKAVQEFRGADYVRYERRRGRTFSLSLGYGF